jgi:hypothetical protein
VSHACVLRTAHNSHKRLLRFQCCAFKVLSYLQAWFNHNGFCFNPDKPEAILFGTRQRRASFTGPSKITLPFADVELYIVTLGVSFGQNIIFVWYIYSNHLQFLIIIIT